MTVSNTAEIEGSLLKAIKRETKGVLRIEEVEMFLAGVNAERFVKQQFSIFILKEGEVSDECNRHGG